MKRMKIPQILLATLVSILFCTQLQAQTDTLSWPREVVINKVTTTLYEPQLESYDNNLLQGRMAVSYIDDKQNMQFGALWFKATLSTDLDSRTVELIDLNITKVVFPSIQNQSNLDEYKKELSLKIEGANIEMSLDRLIANLQEVKKQKTMNDEDIQNTPPQIIFRTTPTILITIDGTPSIKEDTKNSMDYVQNTPFFIVRPKGGTTWYLKGSNWWFSSASITSGWKNEKKIPKKIEKYAEQMQNKQENQSTSAQQTTQTAIPQIVVSTVPAELIVTDGKPNYATVDGTNLLYVKNTESNIIEDITTQDHYILLAGRWFHSHALDNGTWTFCKPSDLPSDFSKIPANSNLKNVLASVPNTPQAQDALLEQSIPQTATVKRNEATVSVTYDGAPKFQQISGTQITYAVNTQKTVLFAQNKYYCVDNGVWFVSNSPTGPFSVADKRPDGVENIPADCPVNNVKYVYIYDSTPDNVYVGYLPGYTYSYVYDGVVVYGTGYSYNPWFGSYYYPQPFTWGFGVVYSPWTGWGFAFGFGWMGWGFHPYWGGYSNGYRHGYARGRYDAYHHSHNVYNGRRGISTGIENRAGRGSSLRSTNKANNLVADRSGNVFKQDHSGKWADANRTNTKNNIQNRTSGMDRSQFNQTMESRSRGNANYSNFRQSRPSMGGGGFGGGGFRGGRR